jgi:hypothetical protein
VAAICFLWTGLLGRGRGDDEQVGKRVGQANGATNLRLYAHQFAQADDAAANIIEAALKVGETGCEGPS